MFSVLYQDEFIIAIDKPEKWLVHRSDIDKYETRFVVQALRDQIQQHVYPVHRLDKPTSGVLVFALNPEIAADISALFRDHQVDKTYTLLVRGWSPDEGEIDYALSIKSEFKHRKEKDKEKPPQEALTRYKTLSRYELPVAVDRYPKSRYSLVEAYPKTGRKHQLRRHFKHIAHPIIGDPKHGKSVHNHYFAEHLDADRLLLHCRRMAFRHPVTGAALDITVEPSGTFKQLLLRLQQFEMGS